MKNFLQSLFVKKTSHEEKKVERQYPQFRDLKEISGLYHIEGSDEPYTGITESYLDNKLLSRERLKNGKIDGLWEMWSTDTGFIFQRETFKEGMNHGLEETFHDSGEIWIRKTFVEDKKHGPEEHYDKYGTLEMRVEYEDDKEHGLSEIFYSDFHGLSPGDRGYGKLYSKCLYKEGDRLWREEFDLDGNMTRRD